MSGRSGRLPGPAAGSEPAPRAADAGPAPRATAERTRRGARIDIGRSVPGWAVHAVLGASMLAALLAGMWGSDVSPALLGVAAAGLAGGTVANAVRPGFGVGTIAIALALLPFLLTAPAGYSWRSPVLIVLVHAVVRLSWLGTVVSPRTRVETAVLATEGRRSAVLNLVGQVVALGAGALTASSTSNPSMTWPWFAVLGGVAVLVLALLLRNGLPTGHDAAGRRP